MNATSEWWESFFHGPWGELQARGFMQENTRAEADFLVRALAIRPGDEVLDVACGTGRHAIELAGRGMAVTGIDFNAATLAVAEAGAIARGVRPTFIKSDMRCLRYRDRFDAAYCFWTSFGYFEDESHDLVVAKRVAEALRPGGRFLIDITVAETLLPVFRPEYVTPIDPVDASSTDEVRQNVRFDFESGRIENDWTFVENGSTRTAHSSVRLYTCHELVALLREVGFERFEAYDSMTGEAFGIGARRLGLVASL